LGGELINSFYPGAFFSFSSDSNFSFNYTANKVQNTPDKGSSSNDIQAIKAQFNHKRVPTGIKSKTSSLLPDKFKLFQNFPNPFNPSTTIEFSLPRSVFVDLKVFNFLGQEVALLVSKELVAGTYTMKWDATGMASGIYFYRLQADKFIDTKKILFLK
jgi:hypothetical protein